MKRQNATTSFDLSEGSHQVASIYCIASQSNLKGFHPRKRMNLQDSISKFNIQQNFSFQRVSIMKRQNATTSFDLSEGSHQVASIYCIASQSNLKGFHPRKRMNLQDSISKFNIQQNFSFQRVSIMKRQNATTSFDLSEGSHQVASIYCIASQSNLKGFHPRKRMNLQDSISKFNIQQNFSFQRVSIMKRQNATTSFDLSEGSHQVASIYCIASQSNLKGFHPRKRMNLQDSISKFNIQQNFSFQRVSIMKRQNATTSFDLSEGSHQVASIYCIASQSNLKGFHPRKRMNLQDSISKFNIQQNFSFQRVSIMKRQNATTSFDLSEGSHQVASIYCIASQSNLKGFHPRKRMNLQDSISKFNIQQNFSFQRVSIMKRQNATTSFDLSEGSHQVASIYCIASQSNLKGFHPRKRMNLQDSISKFNIQQNFSFQRVSIMKRQNATTSFDLSEGSHQVASIYCIASQSNLKGFHPRKRMNLQDSISKFNIQQNFSFQRVSIMKRQNATTSFDLSEGSHQVASIYCIASQSNLKGFHPRKRMNLQDSISKFNIQQNFSFQRVSIMKRQNATTSFDLSEGSHQVASIYCIASQSNLKGFHPRKRMNLQDSISKFNIQQNFSFQRVSIMKRQNATTSFDLSEGSHQVASIYCIASQSNLKGFHPRKRMNLQDSISKFNIQQNFSFQRVSIMKRQNATTSFDLSEGSHQVASIYCIASQSNLKGFHPRKRMNLQDSISKFNIQQNFSFQRVSIMKRQNATTSFDLSEGSHQVASIYCIASQSNLKGFHPRKRMNLQDSISKFNIQQNFSFQRVSIMKRQNATTSFDLSEGSHQVASIYCIASQSNLKGFHPRKRMNLQDSISKFNIQHRRFFGIQRSTRRFVLSQGTHQVS